MRINRIIVQVGVAFLVAVWVIAVLVTLHMFFHGASFSGGAYLRNLSDSQNGVVGFLVFAGILVYYTAENRNPDQARSRR